MKKTCETCNAWVPSEHKNLDGGSVGTCHARPVAVMNSWTTPQGSGWQGGFPSVSGTEWCREHREKRSLAVAE
jgi:hypothetical protein